MAPSDNGNGVTRTSNILDLILKSAGVIAIIGAILSALLYVQLQPVQAQIAYVNQGNANTQAMVERYMANRRNVDSLVCVTLNMLVQDKRDMMARLDKAEKKIEDMRRR